jgi:hypothetical protein
MHALVCDTRNRAFPMQSCCGGYDSLPRIRYLFLSFCYVVKGYQRDQPIKLQMHLTTDTNDDGAGLCTMNDVTESVQSSPSHSMSL